MSALGTLLTVAGPAAVRLGSDAVRRARSQGRALPQRGPARAQSARALGALPEFDDAQRAAIAVIGREARFAPLEPPLARARTALALALVVNAWKESRLRPAAFNGRGEQSFGLFQVNRNAHPQYSAEELRDAAGNTRAFLEILDRQARRFEDPSLTVAELTALVTYWGERPSRREEATFERFNLARRWYGPLADQLATEVRP